MDEGKEVIKKLFTENQSISEKTITTSTSLESSRNTPQPVLEYSDGESKSESKSIPTELPSAEAISEVPSEEVQSRGTESKLSSTANGRSSRSISESSADTFISESSTDSKESEGKKSDLSGSQEEATASVVSEEKTPEDTVTESLSIVHYESAEDEVEGGDPKNDKCSTVDELDDKSNERTEAVEHSVIKEGKIAEGMANIVNHLSVELLDDSVKVVLNLWHRKSLISSTTSEEVAFIKRPSEKAVEKLCLSIIDEYVRDTLHLFCKVLGVKPNLKPEVEHEAVPDQSYTTSRKPPEPLEATVDESSADSEPEEKQHSAKREQHHQPQQQYPFFFRRIPNKPPPPYTPPVREDCVERVLSEANRLIDEFAKEMEQTRKLGLPLAEMPLPENVTKGMDLCSPNQRAFAELAFDLTKELLLENFCEKPEKRRPWLLSEPLAAKPLLSDVPQQVNGPVRQKVRVALGLPDPSQFKPPERKRNWSVLKLGRRDRDFIDKVLIEEVPAEEREWVNYDYDEMTVKLSIADHLLNMLVDDTVQTIKSVQAKIQPMAVR